jgi:outer membrane protein
MLIALALQNGDPMFKRMTFGLFLASLTPLANAENLLQIYQQAKGYDARIKALESEYQAIKEQKVQALAATKPQATVSGAASMGYANTQTDRPSHQHGDYTSGNYSVNLSKTLYNKSLDVQVEQSDAVIAQAKAGLEVERQDLIMRVAQAYFEFLLAQDNVQFAKAEKQAIAKQLEQVKAYFEAGQVAITDVKEVEAQNDLAEARVISANQQRDIANEKLRVLTGRSYKTLATLRSNVPLLPPKPNNIKHWINTATKNNPNLISARFSIDSAQKEIDKQRASRKPTVDFVANHSGSFANHRFGVDTDQYDTSIGVQMNVPLYTSGASGSRIRAAKFSRNQAQQQYEFSKRQVVEQVSGAFISVKSNISQVTANRKALTSATVAAEASRAGFEVGTRTAVDVLTSLRETFRAERDYANARYNYLVSTLNLKQAAGTLNANDVKAMTQYLMPYRPRQPIAAAKRATANKTATTPALTPTTSTAPSNSTDKAPQAPATATSPAVTPNKSALSDTDLQTISQLLPQAPKTTTPTPSNTSEIEGINNKTLEKLMN